MSSISETSRRYSAYPQQRGSNLGRLFLAFVVTLIAGLAFAAAFTLGYARLHENKVMPGVSVAGVAIGGLDRSAAEARLREQLPRLDAGSLTVEIGDSSQRIGYAELGRDYDLAPVLDQAFSVGRAGSIMDQLREQLGSLSNGAGFAVGMRYDQAALERTVRAAALSVEASPVDATVKRNGTAFTATPATTGLDVDEAAAARKASEAIAGTATGTGDVSIRLESSPLQPAVTTAAAEAAAASANALGANPVRIIAAAETLTIPAATIASWVDVTTLGTGAFEVTLDTRDVSALIEPFATKLSKPARNATFRFQDGKVVAVPGANGEALDIAASTAAVDQALRALQPGDPAPTVQLALAPLRASYTTEQAMVDAPKMKRVSAWNTSFPVSERNFFGKNISVPTTKIDGYVVPAGKSFDFWKVVGEVSRKTGYGSGAAIINGRTEPTGALAGGICSCSTTLFNAALRLGLDMGARRNHYYYIDRYPLGLDATVFKSSGGAVTTMSFKNDTSYPILIRGLNAPGKVRFELWSQPTDRKVTFSKPIVRNVRRATDERACTTDLRPGRSVRVEYPTNGMQVWVTRTVNDASGTVIHRDTYRSNYGRVNGMTLFGKPAGFTGPCTERLR